MSKKHKSISITSFVYLPPKPFSMTSILPLPKLLSLSYWSTVHLYHLMRKTLRVRPWETRTKFMLGFLWPGGWNLPTSMSDFNVSLNPVCVFCLKTKNKESFTQNLKKESEKNNRILLYLWFCHKHLLQILHLESGRKIYHIAFSQLSQLSFSLYLESFLLYICKVQYKTNTNTNKILLT